MNTGKLDVLGNRIGYHLAILCYSIHLNLLGMFDKLTNYHWVILTHIGCQLQESLQLFLIRTYVHRSTRKHVARTNQYRETYTLDEVVDVLHRGQGAPLWLVDAVVGQHLRELGTVLSVIDVLGSCTQDWHVLCIQVHSQVVWNLTTEGINLMALPLGTQLKIGDDVLLELSQQGKVCHKKCAIFYLAGDCIFPREGIFFVALTGGKVKAGDSIDVVKLGDGTCEYTPQEALDELANTPR